MNRFDDWNSELYHHGIKGQRWGVRRFQNSDGSLTPEGKERYADLIKQLPNSKLEDYVSRQKDAAGIYNKNGTETIRKGSVIQRIADEGDVIDSRRKYVSILSEDNRTYESMRDMLGLRNPAKAVLYNYEATRDLRIAGKKLVEDYLISKYGNQSVKEALKTVRDLEKIDDLSFNSDRLKKRDRKFVTKLKEQKDKGASIVNNFFKDSLFKNERISSDTLASFKKLGYDAIVDVEDAGIANMPLILINPQTAIKNKRSKQLYT